MTMDLTNELSRFKKLIDEYMHRTMGLSEYCDRCLRTERWNGNVVLMVIDAAFTSIGLNYFKSVVPKVLEFNAKFIETGRIRNLSDLVQFKLDNLRSVWKNKRSWLVAKKIAKCLNTINKNDRLALITWAANSDLERWRDDPIGRISGVGLVTYQYLRMMGGVDTVMPDKIVKRVINDIFSRAGLEPVSDDILFIKRVEEIAKAIGYRPIELCWMTWLIQSEGEMIRMNEHAKLLPI